MKNKTKAVLALSVASVMACGILAGCDLVTTDSKKDYEQVIAEVNITNTDDFKSGGAYAAYKDAIQTDNIYKRDMIASFVSSGSSVMSQYGWTYRDTFDAIKDSLVNRQVYVQYAKLYFLTEKNEDGSARFTDKDGNAYTVAGYKAALKGDTEIDKTLAGLKYFLTDDEANKALYDLRVSFNSSLDSLETSIINFEDEHTHTDDVRTTPTGINTENEDYFNPDYKIYTGSQVMPADYEPVDGSTAYTRRQAYATFLTNIRSSGLLNADEDTTSVEGLSYFKSQLKSAYESAIVTKMADAFEEDAAKDVDDAWMQNKYNSVLKNQKDGFAADTLDIDSALDGMSDSSFVLTAPQAGYGFVINILLPFSAQQTQSLGDVEMDAGDKLGNKFAWRASILKNVKATDQRGTWFTGEEDYSYEAEDGYTGTLSNTADRKYLFFEDALKNADPDTEGLKQYDALKNYYGKYTYNGKVTKDEDGKYTVKPTKINIDEFIDEMEDYLESAGFTLGTPTPPNEKYFDGDSTKYYNDDNKVDYSKFVYYEGSVNFTNFNANNLFVAGTEENKAFSVINELSFAYNTDTAGLNSYLGYAVTPEKTNFVAEFEYAAQKVCAEGAGHYIVTPSDYGWHIIYCTFSFTKDNMKPFSYNASEKDTEGSFSNLFYESQKAAAVSSYASNKQTEIINKYASASATVYEDRYADLSNLDTNS